MIILLDLDETLIREREARDKAASEFLRQFSIQLCFSEKDFLAHWHEVQERHFLRFTRGEIGFQEHRRERLREIFSSDQSEFSDSELDSRFDFYLKRYENNWALFDDVLPFLRRTKDCRLGIVTNGDSDQQRAKLKRTGISDYFEAVVISSEIGKAKPEPEIFLEACRILSVSPAECLFIGDRIDLDMEGSKAAGMRSIWLDRTGHAPRNVAFKSVRSLLEIEIEKAEPSTPANPSDG